MKKRIAFRKLSRKPAHKWSMMRNMVSSLIEHERIVTTVAKAKEIRHLADQMVTLAKKGGSLQQQIEADSVGVTSESLSSEKDTVPSQAKASPAYLHNRRRAAAIVRGDDNVTKLFEVLGPRYNDRQGGYTRVMKIARNRHGDNAPMAAIEYVDRPGEIRAARPPSRTLSEMLLEMGISPVDELGIPPEEVKELQAQAQQE
mmetsp:Transcript_53107/g.128936  ORF Transcript_53107/g.128936 Transcript_53107/m.128936 type:complete len:201 (-) Transcript_53107:414-1016(-)